MKKPAGAPADPLDWSTEDVAQWVGAVLGGGEGSSATAAAAHAIVEQEVTGAAVLECSEADWRLHLGVPKLGARKKLFQAQRWLARECAAFRLLEEEKSRRAERGGG